jgi:hypothetical protein
MLHRNAILPAFLFFKTNIGNGAPCGMRPPALFQSSACEEAAVNGHEWFSPMLSFDYLYFPGSSVLSFVQHE